MRRVVILRPEPGASETLARAAAIGLDAATLPLFRIEPVVWSAPDHAAYDALLVTSANAIRCAGPELGQLRSLPAYAVGEATAKALRSAGFEVWAIGSGGVEALLAGLEPGLRLLHLCGEDHHRPDDPKQRITPLIVYRSVAVAQPEGVEQLLDAMVLVHSPRAGQRLAQLVPDRSTIRIVAISAAAADACGGGWADVRFAETPRDEALLSLALRLCKGPDRK